MSEYPVNHRVSSSKHSSPCFHNVNLQQTYRTDQYNMLFYCAVLCSSD